jgi:hypothetical protein
LENGVKAHLAVLYAAPVRTPLRVAALEKVLKEKLGSIFNKLPLAEMQRLP